MTLRTGESFTFCLWEMLQDYYRDCTEPTSSISAYGQCNAQTTVRLSEHSPCSFLNKFMRDWQK